MGEENHYPNTENWEEQKEETHYPTENWEENHYPNTENWEVTYHNDGSHANTAQDMPEMDTKAYLTKKKKKDDDSIDSDDLKDLMDMLEDYEDEPSKKKAYLPSKKRAYLKKKSKKDKDSSVEDSQDMREDYETHYPTENWEENHYPNTENWEEQK